jgi:hypothetical protein
VQVQGAKGAAVLTYRKPFATQQMRRNRHASGKNGRDIFFPGIHLSFQSSLLNNSRPFL